MQVILLEKVGRLGNVGDRVRIKAGYGRNFLIPFGKALMANKKNIEMFEAKRVELEQNAKEAYEQATQRAEKLSNMTVVLKAKAGEEGKLFGSVTNRDIAEAVSAKGIAVAKREVQMPTGPLRAIGQYDMVIQLAGDVNATIKLVIEPEKSEK